MKLRLAGAAGPTAAAAAGPAAAGAHPGVALRQRPVRPRLDATRRPAVLGPHHALTMRWACAAGQATGDES